MTANNNMSIVKAFVVMGNTHKPQEKMACSQSEFFKITH